MKVIIDINKEHYELIKWVCENGMGDGLQKKVINGTPLDNIRAEIDGIEISGQIDEHTAFIRTGEQVKQMALDVIDKYRKDGI